MRTGPATSAAETRDQLGATVVGRPEIIASGVTRRTIDAHLDAGRWQLVGRAVVLHSGGLDRRETLLAALINCGPRAALTGYTALELAGLRGWARPHIDVLVPVGVREPAPRQAGIRLHRTRDWAGARVTEGPMRRHATSPSAVVAAAQPMSARIAVGLVAAVVQQRLVRVEDLRTAVREATRTRHRRALLLALDDIAMGSHALSEIDFVRLCRRAGLPLPVRQAIRIEPNGRRRYLDALWVLSDGRRVAVEVDGSVHTAPRQWFEDQLRQNTVVLNGTLLLRFPTLVVREESGLVVDQLSAALAPVGGS